MGVDIGRIFHALSDSARRSMVEQLSNGPQSVSQLAGPLNMTLAAVVQHVNLLESCGLIKTRKQGRVRTCEIDTVALSSAEQWLQERRCLWERRLDRLGDLLNED
jgi:DNA-binding transcriptional ArsR family regulator